MADPNLGALVGEVHAVEGDATEQGALGPLDPEGRRSQGQEQAQARGGGREHC